MTRRTPQYVRCTLCSHQWIGYWLPMSMQAGTRIMECAHCPMCAADGSYINRQNRPVEVDGDVSAANVRVTITATVDSDMSAVIRLFMGQVQIGDPASACKYPRAVRLMLEVARSIDNAAGYVRAQRQAQLEVQS